MKWLSRKEEYVLLAIAYLANNAYGVTIREYLAKTTGKHWSIGATYDVLDTLVRKKCIKATIAAPTSKRGGRSKRLYHISDKGLRELEKIRELQRTLWPDLSKPVYRL